MINLVNDQLNRVCETVIHQSWHRNNNTSIVKKDEK